MKRSEFKLYDTMSRKKKIFKPMESGIAKIYACGPTVYSNPHIGNYRAFIVADILRRWLDYKDYKVFMTMNITDIDDKTIRDSGKKGIPLQEFTEGYIKSFLRGIDQLNIKRATVYPKATDYIPKMIDFTKELVEKGFAYEAEDGVYFDIDKFPRYGKLSGIDLDNVETTERMTLDEYDKESIYDFAVWKKSNKNELERGVYYNSPWGPGRPGWHIECSAMSKILLGETIDIHIGGEDLVFPHHENEIAQSEALSGKTFVRFWVHIRHLMINGGKMSKSLGNYVTFDEALSKYSPDTIRYFYLTTHYRKPLDYTEQVMESAKNSSLKLENTLDLIEDIINGPDVNLDYGNAEQNLLEELYKQKINFETAMNNDLDTHGALDAIHATSGIINQYIVVSPNKGILQEAYDTYKLLLNTLGLYEKRVKETGKLTEDLLELIINIRQKLREERNFELADKIRTDLSKAGVSLIDTPTGTKSKI